MASLPASRLTVDNEELMCDLAGNAFPGTMMVAATVALLAHVPWNLDDGHEEAPHAPSAPGASSSSASISVVNDLVRRVTVVSRQAD